MIINHFGKYIRTAGVFPIPDGKNSSPTKKMTGSNHTKNYSVHSTTQHARIPVQHTSSNTRSIRFDNMLVFCTLISTVPSKGLFQIEPIKPCHFLETNNDMRLHGACCRRMVYTMSLQWSTFDVLVLNLHFK